MGGQQAVRFDRLHQSCFTSALSHLSGWAELRVTHPNYVLADAGL